MQNNQSQHTKRVTLLRRVLVGGAALAGLALIGLSNTERFTTAPMDGDIRLSGSGPVVDNPDYQGRTAAGRAYRLQGKTARNLEDNTALLSTPRLAIAATADAAAINITADEARLKSGEQALLRGAVEAGLSDGNRLTTAELSVNISTQDMAVPQELAIDGPQIKLRAARMDGNLETQIFTLQAISMTLQRSAK